MEKSHTKEELFVPHSDKALATAKQMKDMMDKSMQTIYIEKNSGMRLLDGSGVEVKEDDRPRLFVMAGSGSGVMQVIKKNQLKIFFSVFFLLFLYRRSSAIMSWSSTDVLFWIIGPPSVGGSSQLPFSLPWPGLEPAQ